MVCSRLQILDLIGSAPYEIIGTSWGIEAPRACPRVLSCPGHFCSLQSATRPGPLPKSPPLACLAIGSPLATHTHSAQVAYSQTRYTNSTNDNNNRPRFAVTVDHSSLYYSLSTTPYRYRYPFRHPLCCDKTLCPATSSTHPDRLLHQIIPLP